MTMDYIEPKQLRAIIKKLPEDIQDVIYAPETLDTLERIATNHKLDTVHTGLLTRITVRLMTGILHPNEFIGTIIEDLGIPHDKALLVAQEINRELLNPIKDSLMKVHARTETSPAMQKIAAQTIPDIILPPKSVTAMPGAATPAPRIDTPPVPPMTPRPLPMTAAQSDPSPRTVATPQSALASKLGNTYRVEPTVPHYGFTPGVSLENKISSTSPAPSSPVAPAPCTPVAPLVPAQARPISAPTPPRTIVPPQQPTMVPQTPKPATPSTVPPTPTPKREPTGYTPPAQKREAAQPTPPPVPVQQRVLPAQPTPPPTQPARYYPPAPPSSPQ